MLTLRVRPFMSFPLRPVIAFSASSSVGISTNANPLDSPLSWSVMILADATSPKAWKASRSSVSVTSCGRLPTYMFIQFLLRLPFTISPENVLGLPVQS